VRYWAKATGGTPVPRFSEQIRDLTNKCLFLKCIAGSFRRFWGRPFVSNNIRGLIAEFWRGISPMLQGTESHGLLSGRSARAGGAQGVAAIRGEQRGRDAAWFK
jgi:hypothetical protein